MDLELIQIEHCSNIKGIKFRDKENVNNFPTSRGTVVKINDNEALLWIHGNIMHPGFNNNMNYLKGAKGNPSPYRIRRFIGTAPLEKVAQSILMLTKMDYNSADNIYSSMPVPIKYAEKATNILKQGTTNIDIVDFRYII